MPIMRKMNLINVHFWTYLSTVIERGYLKLELTGVSDKQKQLSS